MIALLLVPAFCCLYCFCWSLISYAWLSFHADSVITGLIAVPNGGANWLRLSSRSTLLAGLVPNVRFTGVSVGLELVLALLIALPKQWP